VSGQPCYVEAQLRLLSPIKKPRLGRAVLSLSIMSLMAAGVLVLSACSGNKTPVPQTTPTSAGNTRQGSALDGVPPKAASSAAVPPMQASTGLPSPANRVQKNEAGSVTIEVTWETEQASSDSFRFAVSIDTHSVNLDQYDLSKLAILRNDKGQQVAPTAWNAPPGGGHHRSGTIVFPAAGGGKSLVGADTKYVELVIRDVAGVKERVLRWNLGTNS